MTAKEEAAGVGRDRSGDRADLAGRDHDPDPFEAGRDRDLRLPNQRAIVNVVAVFLVLFSLLPLYLAQRLTRDGSTAGGRV